MKLVLKDFQEEAVESLYDRVSDARRRTAQGRLEVVTLAAPTGSGKTVILTRLIELIMQGDETRNLDPDAAFLWLTDQPKLNIQTRDKMEATSDFLSSSILVEIAADFDYEAFLPGKVYFLNTQKLGAGTNFVRTGDTRSFTLWDTVRNTAQTNPDRFFVIIDEAHRGTRLDKAKADEANSIMRKFVLGSDELPPVPLILGISATLDRFTELLEAAARARRSRTHHRVDIHPADVIGSGLLKSKVILHNPKQTLGAEYPLLRDAARSWRDMEQRWRSYCSQQGEPQVVQPILLVQVEDGNKSKTSNTDLEAVIAAIRDEVGGLPNSAFSHAFQEGTDVYLTGGVSIRHIAPSAINGDPNVRVVLFKSSLNTGWDCPRAEVMMSFRHAKDATLIAQLVGRMVRAPLARRIDYDDVLNSVSLMLPNFDDAQLSRVIAHITSDPDNIVPTEIERSTSRVILNRAAELEPCVKA
jgi:type III restriction enzyme